MAATLLLACACGGLAPRSVPVDGRVIRGLAGVSGRRAGWPRAPACGRRRRPQLPRLPSAASFSAPAPSTFPPASSQPQSGPPPIVSAAAASDTFTLTFGTGTPQFSAAPQSSSSFVQDPSGRSLTLAGSAGVKIVLRGFRGDRQNHAGPQSLSSSGPLLLQVMEIGDFEGVVTWAAGLSSPGCASVTASGSTLTFRFIPVSGKG